MRLMNYSVFVDGLLSRSFVIFILRVRGVTPDSAGKNNSQITVNQIWEEFRWSFLQSNDSCIPSLPTFEIWCKHIQVHFGKLITIHEYLWLLQYPLGDRWNVLSIVADYLGQCNLSYFLQLASRKSCFISVLSSVWRIFMPEAVTLS